MMLLEKFNNIKSDFLKFCLYCILQIDASWFELSVDKIVEIERYLEIGKATELAFKEGATIHIPIEPDKIGVGIVNTDDLIEWHKEGVE